MDYAEPSTDISSEEMREQLHWDYAIGLIKVDGLEPTPEFKEYIEKEKTVQQPWMI